jgi:hypothetical protein
VERADVIRTRLATQRLSSAPLRSAADVVRLLTCVQSQERDHAFFSLGLRSKRSTYAAVRREFDRGAFLRTHILRPTWHFVLPEDLRWILDLTSARVISSMAARHRQLGLDDTRRVDDGFELLTKALQGRNFLTRAELGELFREAGSPVQSGPELGHLLLLAELRGLVCSGPVKGVQHSYALVDEVVPPSPPLEREEAVRRLALRFFTGHGPATVKDFVRWCLVTGTETKAALADLGDELEQVDVDGVPHWWAPDARPRTSPAAPAAYLLPTYDEVVLTYPKVNFPKAPGTPNSPNPDLFWSFVVEGGEEVGAWKRTLGSREVEVQVRLATSLTPRRRDNVRQAAQRLADFLERELVYREV